MTVKQKQFNLVKVINEVSKLFHAEAIRKKGSFEISIDKEVPKHLIGDEEKIHHLLHNLLYHSIQQTKVGGKMKLTVIVLQMIPHMEHLAGIVHIAFKIECDFPTNKQTGAISMAQLLAHALKGEINVLYGEENTVLTLELRLTQVQTISISMFGSTDTYDLVPAPKPPPPRSRSQRLEIPGSDRTDRIQRHIHKSDL